MICTNFFLFVLHVCLSNPKKFFQKAYSSADSGKSLFWRTRLKLSPLKFLKILCDICLALAFEKCNLNTDQTSLWKSESLFKTLSVLNGHSVVLEIIELGPMG